MKKLLAVVMAATLSSSYASNEEDLEVCEAYGQIASFIQQTRQTQGDDLATAVTAWKNFKRKESGKKDLSLNSHETKLFMLVFSVSPRVSPSNIGRVASRYCFTNMAVK